MDESKKFSYLFIKSPLVRLLSFLVLISIVIVALFIFHYKTRPVPFIDAVTPPVGSPGDVVVISGRNFGKERDMNYVEFGGSKLTASSYLMWTDNTIKIVIPANVQDGLVVVGSGKLRSKPAFFANVTDIPVEVPELPKSNLPVIAEIKASKKSVGNLITIIGNNFGNSRGQSKIYFSVDYDKNLSSAEFINSYLNTEEMLAANDDDYCYEYWSDSEIKVRVPDGAYPGAIIVQTSNGKSEPYEFMFDGRMPGLKSFYDKKIYLLQYSVDLAEVETKGASIITLRCPLPLINSSQNSLEITEISPEPILENYQKTLIHQFSVEKNTLNKTYFRQTFVLPVYAISTTVNETYVPQKFTEMSQQLFTLATKADSFIPSDDEKIIELGQTICGTEKSPYKKAKLIYDYMISNFSVEDKFRKDDANPLDLLKRKKGDVYDFAIIYTALLRSQEIPSFADCGVLVSPELATRCHAWSEFFICGVGWIPVDVALGAGLDFANWDENLDVANFYFGNLDSHHIKFSRGLNELKSFSQNSKIVQRPRSFAFQTIWEEASNETVKYSSFWSEPIVKGIY